MKAIQRILLTAALGLGVGWLGGAARAQQILVPPLQMDQTLMLYHTNLAGTNVMVGVNWQSYRGVPLSSTNGNPKGSDGRAPALQFPTSNQFRGMFVASGIPVQKGTNLISTNGFSTNVTAINWPRATADGTPSGKVVFILRSAQVGAPYFAQQVSFLFGDVIAPPSTDENGKALPLGDNLSYWVPQPYTTNNYAGAPYYYSPNAQAVFATQAGSLSITWQKLVPTNGTPPDLTNYAYLSGNYYRLYNVHYIVSGAAVKPPQKMYWTEGSYQETGHPIQVSQAQVNAVNVIYNQNFPQYVTPGDTGPTVPVTNTLWFSSNSPPFQIRADNLQGRVFVELLGEVNPDGATRRFLGFEIVDVYKEPLPVDVTVNLGERVPAYQDGQDDSFLDPSPVANTDQSFYYRQVHANGTFPTLWATRLTQNLNDFQVHWLITGVAGLEWPYVFDRYHEVWPANASAYVNYVRPATTSAAQAKLTAVQLPAAEAPAVVYQDPLDGTYNGQRAIVESSGLFYSIVDAAHPAQRALIQFDAGGNVFFERVFSYLDTALKAPIQFTNSVATSLDSWNAASNTMDFSSQFAGPYYYTGNASVGDRILAPPGELGSSFNSAYLAGYIVQSNGNLFNPRAYIDPFQGGFKLANLGAIIPVNSMPANNSLEVWWFRTDSVDASLGFQPSYWPAVIAHYNLHWPTDAPEIIMANNAGTGPLDSLQAKGVVYRQPDRTQPGYNPNEEHAVTLGGQAYALRDDLNVTNGDGYTSDPFVLIDYTGGDGRPMMAPYHVRREAAEAGELFDYIVDAGTMLQAPMPLPLLDAPILGTGAYATNFNTAPLGTAGDLPQGWSSAILGQPSFSNYSSFTFQDRKHNFWVYRGLNAGLPPLQVGTYDQTSDTFGPLAPAVATVGQPFTYFLHLSRRIDSLNYNVTPSLPDGLSLTKITNFADGIAIVGNPTEASSNVYSISILDTGDNTSASAMLNLQIGTNGSISEQPPLVFTSTNKYSHAQVYYVGRPPFLAQAADTSNTFTMRFYYKTQASFDWPSAGNPPPVGSIVPYLLPLNTNGIGFAGDPTTNTTTSLDIVYRPVWPSVVNNQPVPTLSSGQTAALPVDNLPSIRGQSSVQVLYQQSIATNGVDQGFSNQSVVLYDPTVQKTALLSNLPPGVITTSYQGKDYFPGLPPNLKSRFFYDPNTLHLVLQGAFSNTVVGESYLLPNVLAGSDMDNVINLCPTGDSEYHNWTEAVSNLSVQLYTFYEKPGVPGSYVNNTNATLTFGAGQVVQISSSDQQVDSYAMCATGPGAGYISVVVGNTIAPAHASEPVTVYVFRTGPEFQAATKTFTLHPGELKIIEDSNPLSDFISFQHTSDLAGRSSDYEYDWRIAPPIDGLPPASDPTNWTTLITGTDITHYTLGGSGIQTLGDNYVAVRYRCINTNANPATTNWSPFTAKQLASGWIQRVLAGINPFNQRTTDLFDDPVNTTGTIISEAGHRWEGDVALNQDTINSAGLIEIYETVLHKGESLSINSGYNYGPANDALLLAASYLSDLYTTVANDAWSDSLNPTISIGTADKTYGDVATSLFKFQGEVSSLLEQDLALLRGRDDVLQPGVQLAPVYNRLYWNYTLGINAGEVIYALNYDILDENQDGVVNAADAAILYPMGHGDAYGHYLTALNNYYQLLMNPYFDWVPRIEAVSVLGATVSVNYQDERKFASGAAALARTGRQIYDLTWREQYHAGTSGGWSYMDETNINSARPYAVGTNTAYVTKYWGLDHWASRVGQGTYLNWVVGNAILPPVDPDPTHQGIQKVDRTTVPELNELPTTEQALQTDMNNTEAGFTPLNLSQNAIPFDINPLQVTGVNPQTHFEQVYSRALTALNNAVTAFNDAQGVTELMRSEQDSLSSYQAGVTAQELAYNNQLIDIYGTPYPDDIGPGKTYAQGYTGPDLIHYTYVENPDTNTFNGILPDPTQSTNFSIDVQSLPSNWSTTMYTNFDAIVASTAPGYATNTNYVVKMNIGPDGFFSKPPNWTSQRITIGSIQQTISGVIAAQNALRQALQNSVWDKQTLDKDMTKFTSQQTYEQWVAGVQDQNQDISSSIAGITAGYNIAHQWLVQYETIDQDVATAAVQSIPTETIVGTADGGDFLKPVAGAVYIASIDAKWVLLTVDSVAYSVEQAINAGLQIGINENNKDLANALVENDAKNQVTALGAEESSLQNDLVTINQDLRALSDAQAAYQAQVAKGNEVQAERLTFRQHAAAIVQGYRTRDAAFLLFQNEKLQRYVTLFNLAAEYAYLAAQAYDYETGLLNTPQGQSFLNQIISSQAIGIVNNGMPQVGGGDGGDPGLANALAEMDADWQVLKGRLGFNNPDGYGTTVSLRTENYRILGTSDGDANWQQVLQNGRMANLLNDPDVKRYCLQIDNGSGLPVPGIELSFSTVIADGLNLFGNQLAPGDHDFSASSFATKIFSVGVDFDGYVGMDNPAAGGGVTPPNPTSDPNSLSATPYVYLIPVGADSMRSPPLGDVSTVRTWNVDDVAIPLPFNVSASDFSSNPFYTSANSLTEPLFSLRKHQAFRPVSTIAAFNTDIYGATGALQPSQYTNKRLIGRSIWNSKWKLIIPGQPLLSDPNQGLNRFINSVKDVKLYFITYSYAGN